MAESGDAMSLVPGPAGRAAAAAGNLIVTVDRGETITSWNRAEEQLFGFSHQDADGQTLALIMPAEHRPRYVAAFHAAMDSGHPAHRGAVAQVVKFVVPRQDG
jgi:PAS domain S-box-containing protein